MLQLEDVQRRAEAAEAALQEERSAHRRALRHKNRALAEAQVTQDAALCCAMSLYPSLHVAHLRTRACGNLWQGHSHGVWTLYMTLSDLPASLGSY